MTHARDPTVAMAPQPSFLKPVIVTAALTIGLVLSQSSIALLLWVLDGTVALIILAVATVSGFGLLSLFRLGPLPRRWQLMLAAGLGVGFLSLMVLGCGVSGLVGADRRLVPAGILALCALAGLRPLLKLTKQAPTTTESSGAACWIIAAVAPFAALAMLVATLPPGFLWREEGFGYDVLEYHLQLPREYYEAGVIAYLPHNVYANFPSAAEMLYLFANIVTGESIESWSVAKCLNAILGGLAVVAGYLAAGERSVRSGMVTAVLIASAPWLVYLSGVAYVENGLLFLGMLSAACVIRAAGVESPRMRNRWALLAGVMSGLACGFKYTGAAMVALPLGVTLLVLLRVSWLDRLRAAVCFTLAALVIFSPWLIKNAVMTANPVFPLAHNLFTSYPEGWGAEEAEHFAESHAPAPADSTLWGRTSSAWRHIVADPAQRFGAILLALAVVALLRHRQRFELALAMMLITQLLVWLLATHLYARFAVPMLIPLALLAGRGAIDPTGVLRRGFVVLILVGVGFNLFKTCQLYAGHVYAHGARITAEGATRAFTEGHVSSHRHLATVNSALPEDAHLLLVGDARPFYFQRRVDYCVVFNRNPFAEVVAASSTVEHIIAWLRSKGYTHVLVHWGEMERLRQSRYGFSEVITPSLFEQLQDAGLRWIEAFAYEEGQGPYAVLYKVPDN